MGCLGVIDDIVQRPDVPGLNENNSLTSATSYRTASYRTPISVSKLNLTTALGNLTGIYYQTVLNNAIVTLNMNAVTSTYGPSAKAMLLVPLVGAFFIDILNAGTIQFFLGLFQ